MPGIGIRIEALESLSEGKALFPSAGTSGRHWGLEPILNASQSEIDEAQRKGTHQLLDRMPLSRLVAEHAVDLLHIDIQGGEADFIR